jgi:predicted house-cleaning NTP pyrophosphatase (Maf/HAM1 superfamily)
VIDRGGARRRPAHSGGRTRVQLARLGESEIEAYVRTREPFDWRGPRHPGIAAVLVR